VYIFEHSWWTLLRQLASTIKI